MIDACTLIAQHGVPIVVLQALDDHKLPDIDRLVMWHLRLRLDFVEYREVKVASLAHEMRRKERTVNHALDRLTAVGYLDQHTRSRPRAFRFPWSRRHWLVRAA